MREPYHCDTVRAVTERVWDKLFEAAIDQYGYLTPADAVTAGVDPAQLRIMFHRDRLERVDHGLYRLALVPTTELDQYMEMVLRTGRRGVLSDTTALDLLGLCDANPALIHVTVPTGFRTRREFPHVMQLHRRDLRPDEHTLHEGIPIVTPYRAIRDGIETGIGPHLIEQAIATATETGVLTVAEREELVGIGARVREYERTRR